MSRAYDFAVEVCNVTSESEAKNIVDLVERELSAIRIDFWYEPDTSTKTCFMNGECQLCGGESDDEASNRLTKEITTKFPHVNEVVTKWRCMEYLEWDEVYTWEQGDEIQDA